MPKTNPTPSFNATRKARVGAAVLAAAGALNLGGCSTVSGPAGFGDTVDALFSTNYNPRIDTTTYATITRRDDNVCHLWGSTYEQDAGNRFVRMTVPVLNARKECHVVIPQGQELRYVQAIEAVNSRLMNQGPATAIIENTGVTRAWWVTNSVNGMRANISDTVTTSCDARIVDAPSQGEKNFVIACNFNNAQVLTGRVTGPNGETVTRIPTRNGTHASYRLN